jgi:hypothetical protein
VGGLHLELELEALVDLRLGAEAAVHSDLSEEQLTVRRHGVFLLYSHSIVAGGFELMS